MRLYPDESLSRELRSRSLEYSWDSEPIWDCRWHPIQKTLAIYQRKKPDEKYSTGRWTPWAFLRDPDGSPRNLTRYDLNLIKEHVYGQGRRHDDWKWYENLAEEERRMREDDAEAAMDDGFDEEKKFVEWYKKPKVAMGATTNRRHSHAQRRCPHNEWMVECNVCSPQERTVFIGGSGERNMRRERGRRGGS